MTIPPLRVRSKNLADKLFPAHRHGFVGHRSSPIEAVSRLVIANFGNVRPMPGILYEVKGGKGDAIISDPGGIRFKNMLAAVTSRV